MSVLSTVYDHG